MCLAPLILVLAASGCSLPQAAIPPGQTGASVAPSTLAPSSTAPSTGLAAIQACDLLTAQEATTLGVPAQGEADSIAGLRRCDWTSLGGGGVSIAIDEQDGIDKLNLADASSVTDITIGRHRAKRAVETSGPGYCRIDFAVGDTASVGVQALYLDDTPQACAAVDKAAAFVEPKLP
ncbi:MAG: DUF3558 family protein [Pseudonocardiaceae bacterium]